MSTPESEGRTTVNVQRIVDDIQDRVARRRHEAGMDGRAFGVLAELRPGSVVLRPEVSYSTRPVVGPAITAAKRLVLRLNWHLLRDLTDQVNAALDISRVAADAEARRRKAFETRVEELMRRIERLEAQVASVDAASDPSKLG